MYSRNEASRIKQEFWTTFGRYMLPILSADGIKPHWVNYKTGFKDLYFRMRADGKAASVSIEMTHVDLDLQKAFFEKFKSMKSIFEDELGEEWEWNLLIQDEQGKTVSRIFKEIRPVNIYNKESWPELITFFKPRIIALDSFWSGARYAFEEFR